MSPLEIEWERVLVSYHLGMDRGLSKWLVYGWCEFEHQLQRQFDYVKHSVFEKSVERKNVLAARAREWRRKNREHYRRYKHEYRTRCSAERTT